MFDRVLATPLLHLYCSSFSTINENIFLFVDKVKNIDA